MNRHTARAAIVVAIAASMSACTVAKTLTPTGGSRSDGTVKLSYQYGAFEQPKIDMQQGQQAATARCQAWGYEGAEAFGGSTEQCQQSNAYGCVSALVTVEFQCIGAQKPQ